MPDFSTLSRHQKTQQVNIAHLASGVPLHLRVESIGINTLRGGKRTEEGQQTIRETSCTTKAQTPGSKRRARLGHWISGVPYSAAQESKNTLEARTADFSTSGLCDALPDPDFLTRSPPSRRSQPSRSMHSLHP